MRRRLLAGATLVAVLATAAPADAAPRPDAGPLAPDLEGHSRATAEQRDVPEAVPAALGSAVAVAGALTWAARRSRADALAHARAEHGTVRDPVDTYEPLPAI